MPIFATWSSGVHHELVFVAKIFKQLFPNRVEHDQALVQFIDDLRALFPVPPEEPPPPARPQLLGALERLTAATIGWDTVFDEMKNDPDHPGFRFDPAGIEQSWFSMTDSMWRFDSELSPHQVHLIMRETGAEMAERLRGGLRLGRMMTQCNHDRMKVEFFETGPDTYDVWIFVPTNSGWMQAGEPALPDDEIRRQLIEIAAANPRNRSYGPNTDARQRLVNDILSVVQQARASYLPFEDRSVPFNWGNGYESPAPAGEVVVDRFESRKQPGDDQMPDESADLDARTGPAGSGTEIGWGPGNFNAGEAPVASLADRTFPLRWYPDSDDAAVTAPWAEELAKVQANILRPHHREAVGHLLITLEDVEAAKEALAGLTLTTALNELSQLRIPESDLPTIVVCAVSQRGLAKLGLPAPGDDGNAHDAFGRGLAEVQQEHTTNELGSEIDLVVTVAGTTEQVETGVAELKQRFAVAAVEPIGVELGSREDPKLPDGERQHPPAGSAGPRTLDFSTRRMAKTREPFGNVDGISNPWFFTFDTLKSHPNGADQWYEGAGAGIALVDHGDGGYGSFMVFQKLEQNQAAFHEESEAVGKRLGVSTEEGQAAIVGRDPDGDLFHRRGRNDPPQFNDFRWNEENDQAEAVQPHIKLMNPRTPDSTPVVRRSVPYWADETDPSYGILFVAYTASIDDYFIPIEERGRQAGDVLIPAAGNDVVVSRGGEYLYVPPPDCFTNAWPNAAAS